MVMTRAQSFLFTVVAATGGWMATTSPAHAELDACGGIFLSSDASCGYKPKKECMTECMTVAVEESCVSEVYNDCETSCTTTASTECTASCETSCVNNCTTMTTAQKGPSCMDLCVADCDSDGNIFTCTGEKGPCTRCAKHNCNKRCEEKCGDAEEPERVTTTTECMPTCSNACMASCTAKVNTQCQVDCQEKTYTSCQQKMVEKCQTQCEDKGGALFCDGQFVNAADVNDCADEVEAKVKIDVDLEGLAKDTGEAVDKAARDVSKTVDKNVDVDTSCSVSNVGASDSSAAWLALPLTGIAVWRVRRRRANKR